MTLLARRQQSLADQAAQWLATDEKDRQALLIRFLGSYAAEQKEAAELASKMSENMVTWLPLDVPPDQAPITTSQHLAADAARLAGDAATVGKNQDVELVHGFGGLQRLPHHGARTFRGEIILERAMVDLDHARAGP
jgi:hypothetical protein